MKKTTLQFLMLSMFLLLGTWMMGQTKFNITFKVDMADAQNFNMATDDVYISGDFAGWPKPGTVDSLKMSTGLQLNVYELKMEVDSGDIQYKYFFVRNDSASWDHGEWQEEINRKATLTKDTTFFDNWGVLPSGIFESKAMAEYKMYPNPVEDVLNINDLNDVNKIEIFDITGKMVQSAIVESNRISVNISALNSGVYIVSFYTKNGIKTNKFVKN